MNRRTVLAALAVPLAGCGGYAADGNDDGGPAPTSEGDDDAPIEASVEELLLAAEALDDEWEPIDADDENCREFTRSTEEQRFVLTACAQVHEDVPAAETAYEDRVERLHKLSNRGSPTNEDPEVGVEATRIDGRGDANVVFRDANAVGSIKLDAENLGVGIVHGEVDHEDAVEYATAMHERWRE